jgi:D-xylose 1-dehydrogenase (NADP+, D-xylono-1,5-lactone-forming)
MVDPCANNIDLHRRVDMDKKIRWGIISTADINNIMIPAIRKNDRCEVLAISSRNIENAKSYASNKSILKYYGSYESLLEDKEIDAVYVSLPNGMHHEWCVKAARAGKHILCEKPLAISVEDCHEMINEANKHDVFLQEGFMYRYHPQTMKLKKLIDQGSIGQLDYLYGVFSFPFKQAYGNQLSINYRLNSDLGGGCLWDIGSYVINYLRYLTNSEPIEVNGYSKNLPGYQVDGLFCGLIRFPNQVLAQFECSYNQSQRSTMDVFGDKGNIKIPYSYCLVWDSHEQPIVVNDFKNEEIIQVEQANAYESEVDHFCECVLDKKPRLIALDDAVNNIKTLVALHESAKTGHPVILN